jgi:hypothetical protein
LGIGQKESSAVLVPGLSILLFPFRLQPGTVLGIEELGPIAAGGLPETVLAFTRGRISGILLQQNVYYVVVCDHFETLRFLKNLSETRYPSCSIRGSDRNGTENVGLMKKALFSGN